MVPCWVPVEGHPSVNYAPGFLQDPGGLSSLYLRWFCNVLYELCKNNILPRCSRGGVGNHSEGRPNVPRGDKQHLVGEGEAHEEGVTNGETSLNPPYFEAPRKTNLYPPIASGG